MQAKYNLRSLKDFVGSSLPNHVDPHDIISVEDEEVEVPKESVTFILSIEFCVQ